MLVICKAFLYFNFYKNVLDFQLKFALKLQIFIQFKKEVGSGFTQY